MTASTDAETMKRILVTGASGMLGAALVARWANVFDVYATGRHDFAGNPAKTYLPFDAQTGSCDELVLWAQPEVIVHCAAMTNVDACENSQADAMSINGDFVRRLLKAATAARVIFISTDAVMPAGTHLADESTPTNPGNLYGVSKQQGERYLLEAGGDHCVVRTTIVGRNTNQAHIGFADWIVNSVRAGETISLFEDVIFTPITTWRLADELRWLIHHRAPRVLHVAGSQPVSKHDFGFELCRALHLNVGLLGRSLLADRKLRAARSKDQTLSCRLFESISGHELPDVRQTIGELTRAFSDSTPSGDIWS